MATSPEHFDDQMKAPAKAGRPPITASPVFPWIVALWFAALLGIGSLILPVALLERASVGSGFASVMPMAAPPLGGTAQGLLALAGTLTGALLGFTLARRIAAPKRPALVVESERDLFAEPDESEVVESEPHEGYPADRQSEDDVPGDDIFELDPSTELADHEIAGESPKAKESEPEWAEFTPVAETSEQDIDAYRDVADDTASEPLPFSPPSMTRGENDQSVGHDDETVATAKDAGPESEDSVSDNPNFDAPQTNLDEPVEANESEASEAPVNDGAEVGLVQLVQRLSATLDRHREWSAEQAALKASSASEPSARGESEAKAPVTGEFGPAAPEDAAQAMAAYFGEPASAPATDIDEAPAEAGSTAPGFASFEGPVADDDEEMDESAEFGDFASLNPYTRASAHPAPVQEAEGQPRPRASNDDNERALREALINLQRMRS